uniref:Cysteine-rich receptor-like protein kinase 42 n=1 Tax=Cajanus cajan TaxID=3821 RepID=A0A151SVU7_CAJCA|nr:Cysteine-rich receptor-like protein kinase 42 [Cajanus cajan]
MITFLVCALAIVGCRNSISGKSNTCWTKLSRCLPSVVVRIYLDGCFLRYDNYNFYAKATNGARDDVNCSGGEVQEDGRAGLGESVGRVVERVVSVAVGEGGGGGGGFGYPETKFRQPMKGIYCSRARKDEENCCLFLVICDDGKTKKRGEKRGSRPRTKAKKGEESHIRFVKTQKCPCPMHA